MIFPERRAIIARLVRILLGAYARAGAITMSPAAVKEIFEPLLDRYWFTFLAVGVALVCVAALGQIPWIGDIRNQGFANVLLIIGAVLVVVSILLVWRDSLQQGSFLFTPPDELRSEPPLKVKFSGIFGGLRSKDKMWLFTQGTRNAEPVYWPYREVDFSDKTRWSVNYETVNYKDGDVRIFQFYLVGAEGQALIKCYRRLNEGLANPHKTPWMPIGTLTSDIRPIGKQFQVKLLMPK